MDRRSAYDVFTELFEEKLKVTNRYTRAYNEAEDEFEKRHGFTPYSSYNSYRNTRRERLDKRKKPACNK